MSCLQDVVILLKFQTSYFNHQAAIPSSGLYRASYIKYNGFDTQWDPIVFTVIL